MTNLHSAKPKRFDNSEEYQAIYHEKLLKIIAKRDYLWSTYVWNMFDFGADARNQGGDPGKNHKGLVTFDRKIKKDAFFIYKAYLSEEKFVHLCGSRFVNRVGSSTEIKVYSNLSEVELFVNGKSVGKKAFKDHKAIFKVPLNGDLKVEAKAGELSDQIEIESQYTYSYCSKMEDVLTIIRNSFSHIGRIYIGKYHGSSTTIILNDYDTDGKKSGDVICRYEDLIQLLRDPYQVIEERKYNRN